VDERFAAVNALDEMDTWTFLSVLVDVTGKVEMSANEWIC
jgi:hypothetical protein